RAALPSRWPIELPDPQARKRRHPARDHAAAALARRRCVRLRQLRLENLRAFQSLDLDLDPGWNVFIGANGAGKTTLLEAAYLLSHARSFRGGPKDVLVRRGADGYSVFGRIDHGDVGSGLGLLRHDGVLEARVNGATV